jgi:hypothetical protein
MEVHEYLDCPEEEQISAMWAAHARWQSLKGAPFTVVSEDWSFKDGYLILEWKVLRPGQEMPTRTGIKCRWPYPIPNGVTDLSASN